MKLILATAAVAFGLPFYSAGAAVLTVGGPLSALCYHSAMAEDARPSAVESCTRALEEESLSTADRAATYVNRGIVLMSGSRFSEADADFDAALGLEKNLPDGWLNKAMDVLLWRSSSAQWTRELETRRSRSLHGVLRTSRWAILPPPMLT
jgi:hypothetical protein